VLEKQIEQFGVGEIMDMDSFEIELPVIIKLHQCKFLE